jgi:hypothetical protein
MLSIPVPTAPGMAIASDYFQSHGKEYVLFVDLFSSWTEYFKVSSRRPETLMNKLRQFMTRNGIPRIFYSDKGSAYESFEFKSFCNDWGVELITCSGEYPQGNGTAEAAVKRVKKWLSGAKNEDELSKAILAWHQTPLVDGRPTPAQIHLGRNVRDELIQRVEPCKIPWEDVRLWRSAQKENNARTYNKSARDLPDLSVGERVFVSIHGKWRQATIEDKAQRPRSYVLRLSDTGARIERNRVHLRVDKTRTDPVNSYFYFSADGEEEARFQEEEEFDESSVPYSADQDHERRIPEDVRDEMANSRSEPEEEDVLLYPESARNPEGNAEASSKKIPGPRRRDRIKEFLSKTQISRVGRESKKIERYDPSYSLVERFAVF